MNQLLGSGVVAAADGKTDFKMRSFMILRMFIFSALVFVSIYTKNAKAVEKSGSVSAATSDVLALDIKDAIAAALENNPDVKAAKSDLRVQGTSIKRHFESSKKCF